MWNRLLKSIILLSLAFLLGIGVFLLPKIDFDNSHWFDENHPQETYKDYLNQEFQKGENVIFISQLGQSFFTPNFIESTKRISEKIESLEYVKELKTPLSATAAFSDKDSLCRFLVGDFRQTNENCQNLFLEAEKLQCLTERQGLKE